MSMSRYSMLYLDVHALPQEAVSLLGRDKEAKGQGRVSSAGGSRAVGIGESPHPVPRRQAACHARASTSARAAARGLKLQIRRLLTVLSPQ